MMADVGKITGGGGGILQISSSGGGGAVAEMKSFLPLLRTRRAMAVSYALAFAFVAFTALIAFNPGSTPALFFTGSTNVVALNANTTGDRSRFSSVFEYFFPNSTLPQTQIQPQTTAVPAPSPTLAQNATPPVAEATVNIEPKQPLIQASTDLNQTGNNNVSKSNETPIVAPVISKPSSSSSGNGPTTSAAGITLIGKGLGLNYTGFLLRKQGGNSNNTGGSGALKKNRVEELLIGCDLYDGSWVRDDSYPLYQPGSCSLIDEQFNCIANGRPDTDYQKLKWKPHGCTLPRLDPKRMLQMLRGKRLVFVGDSLNRNMWESLVCMLKSAVENQKKVYEAHGRHHFRTEASYSFIFKDYDLSVEFFVSPFLVREWEVSEKDGHKKETLRLDLIGESAAKYKGADIIIFNTGHWWTHEKTSKGEDYYQEGNQVYSKLHVKLAFRKAIQTWARWVDSNVDSLKTIVFFRGYSESHFSGGRWNSGGQCDNETEPIKNVKFLASYPYKMRALETVLHDMKTPVSYLNITRITDYRKDGHPSIYRRQHYSEEEKKSPLRFQDCSHWCLPGVPDIWNELLYAELLVKEYQRKKAHN